MTKPCIAWKRIAVALIFLFNPPINIIDILPDFIGYFLLLTALEDAQEVFPRFDEAYQGFKKMLWISLSKIPALFLMREVLKLSIDERSIIAVFALAFAILEFIFALSAFRAFFDALTHLGEREGLLPVLKAGRGSRGLDGVISLTLIFLLVKGLCSFLPEMSLISVFESLGSLNENAINPAKLYPYFVFIANAIGYALGGVWLYFCAGYFRDLEKSTVMREFSEEKTALFKEKIAQRAIYRHDKLCLGILVAALLLAFDPVLDGKNYLPDFVSALAFLVFFVLSRKNSRYALFGAAVSLLYGAASYMTAFFEKRFLSEYAYAAVSQSASAKAAYRSVEIMGITEAVLLIGTVCLLFLVLRDFIARRVGASFDENNLSSKLSLQRKYKNTALFFTIFGAFSAVFFALEKFLLTLTERHVITGGEANQYYEEGTILYIPIFGGSWFLRLAITALWVFYGIYLISSLKQEIYTDTEK